MFKKKKIKILILLTSTLLLFISFFIFIYKDTHKETNNSFPKNTLPNSPVSKEIKPNKNPEIKTTLEINEVSYKESITEQISVYDFMQKLQAEGKINFKDKNYSGMGKFVEEINGLKSSQNKYWIYYINGKEANVGISNYKINPGDVVSWKLK